LAQALSALAQAASALAQVKLPQSCLCLKLAA